MTFPMASSRAVGTATRPKLRAGALFLSAAVCCSLVAVACGGSSRGRQTSPSTTSAKGGAGGAISGAGKPPVPATGALLGASVYYDHSEPKTGQIGVLEANLGRTLDVDHIYYTWNQSFPGSLETADSQAGRIPFISWGCTNVDAIASGQYDDLIAQRADAIRAYGKPVYIRWYWEMDFKAKNKLPGANCLQADGGAGYIRAWQHIWTVFHDQGATNVAWVWCPGVEAFNRETADQYYPGDSYVDYVCADGYSRQSARPVSFAQIFGKFYAQWAGRKPIIIGETGAEAGSTQSTWITQMDQAVQAQFPDIKVLLYWDSIFQYNYTVTDPASVSALADLARTSYFNPLGKALSSPRHDHDERGAGQQSPQGTDAVGSGDRIWTRIAASGQARRLAPRVAPKLG